MWYSLENIKEKFDSDKIKEKIDKAPRVVYRMHDNDNNIDLERLKKFLTFSKGHVWVITNENTAVRKLQENLNDDEKKYYTFFYLIKPEPDEVIYFGLHLFFTLFFTLLLK